MAATQAATTELTAKRHASIQYSKQANRLGLNTTAHTDENGQTSEAVEAQFVTAQDPVIETANGGRLPPVPIEEAITLNELKAKSEGEDPDVRSKLLSATRWAKDGTVHGAGAHSLDDLKAEAGHDDSLRDAVPPTSTNPLFPPLPMYGPPSVLRTVQSYAFRTSSAILSLCFLGVIVLGAIFTALPLVFKYLWIRIQGQDPDKRRPFWEEEARRRKARLEANKGWASREHRIDGDNDEDDAPFAPTEGGPDPLVCDIAYYARRVGLDAEEFEVQTEDGFIIALYHIYNPKEYSAMPPRARQHQSPETFSNDVAGTGERRDSAAHRFRKGLRKYPILLIHGLLQSPGAFCCTDDDSLAFFLAKSGYDVWLGANRCGFQPKHKLLTYNDPRMWSWNIRAMGVLDLPALISRVLSETGFEKLGLICHSQGTTQTFVALAKEQRPDIGEKISVFCALAPAAYAGPLIKKMYFKFMRVITPSMFRLMFGIHAFIPFMMSMHKRLSGQIYGALGYRVFAFLFNWTDERWERDLRSRLFQFSPVYVSTESMRWWLGRECFARHKCILATKQEGRIEDEEDYEEDLSKQLGQNGVAKPANADSPEQRQRDHSRFAWYNEQAPPFALWIGGSDGLVDGRRLLRRFERGREPHVKLVHSKIIPEYEHLDVIWAMDSIEQVSKEVRQVIWDTMPDAAKQICQPVDGCQD